jgi:hypothetical protein
MRSREWSIDTAGQPFISNQTGARQFRCIFDVDIAPGDSLSFADIRIYGLSKESAIAQRSPIVLRAGFTDAVDTIFSGFTTNVLRERDGPSIFTRILCKGGAPVIDRASVNISFGVNTKVTEVIRAVVAEWPRPISMDNEQFKDDPVFTTGYYADGDIPTILDTLAVAFNFEWIQENGRVVVTKKGAARKTAIKEINQFTGMIGIPEVSRGPDGLGVFVSTQLDPFVRIDSRINVKSEFATFNTGNLFMQELTGDASANGEYNVFSLKHRGDSHGATWRTDIDGLRPGTQPKADVSTSTNGKLIWGARVSQEFRAKVRDIAVRRNLDPNWLMAVMAFETGETFSPSVRNPGSSATGLIQFVEATARGLGTTTTKLARMTAVQQLDFVDKYFEQYDGRLRNLGDTYMAVLWPIAVGRADSYVMWEKTTGPYQAQYAANSGLDVNRNGQITRGEAVARVNQKAMKGRSFVR